MPSSSSHKADQVLATVRKLLAKAEDPAATPQEAETYNAKASDLMATYGIDRALLAVADPDSDVVGDRVVVAEAPYARDKATLLSGIAHEMRCRAVLRTRYPAGVRELSLHLFGYDSDLLRTEVLYTSLLVQASIGIARAPVPFGEQVAAFRRSWLAGFTHAVVQRLAVAEQRAAEQAEPDSPGSPGAQERSVALVLADRSVAVADTLARHYPRLQSGRRRVLSGSGMVDGWAAGQQAVIGGRTLDA
jgi:Protein of unknown function (DUF2786)